MNNTIIPETNTSKSIILSACLFGSLYIFSTSLIELNKKWMKNEPISCFELVNGSILTLSGIVIIKTTHKVLSSMW